MYKQRLQGHRPELPVHGRGHGLPERDLQWGRVLYAGDVPGHVLWPVDGVPLRLMQGHGVLEDPVGGGNRLPELFGFSELVRWSRKLH